MDNRCFVRMPGQALSARAGASLYEVRGAGGGARAVWGIAVAACLCLWQSGATMAGERSTGDEPDPQPRVVLPDESGYLASARDGQGCVTVSPDVVPVRTPVTMTFVYTAADSGIAVGGGVICNVSSFWGWTPPQNQRPDAPGYVTVRCSAEEVPLEVQVDSHNNVVAVLVREQPLRGGQTVTVVYGDTSGGRHPTAQGLSDHYAEREERFFFKVDGDGDGWFAPLRHQARFRVEARRAAKLAVFGPSWSRAGEAFDLAVAALDPSNNLVESFTGKVRLTPSGVSAGGVRTVVFKPDDRGAVRLRVTPEAPGILRVAAADPAGALAAAVSNPVVVSQEAETKYTLYWADLHGHCNVCDGTGSPEDYYRYARDVARLDAAALTDHDHWGYLPLDEDAAAWRRLCELSSSWYEPGRFVTFCGYEWTNWTFGHRHVLFLHEAQAAVFAWQDEKSDHPEELWGLLAGRDCLTIPHHPGGYPMPTFWKYHDPRYEPVVEIASVHGVSEHVGHPRCISSPVESGMVQSALERGYRLGLIGSGDTHDGHPGIGSPGARAGLAGIYATSLTREAIFDALRARRAYATTGCRAILRFHMGDTPMGGVVHVAGPDTRRKLSLTVLGDAPLSAAAIVKNNAEAAVEPGGGLMISLEWTDPEPAKSGDFYYARIVQSDGEWIWSSPIYVQVDGQARSRPAAD